MILRPTRSRFLWIWWCALHAVLAAAVLLVAESMIAKPLVLSALAAHAVIRRPRNPPDAIVVGADGSCAVPEWGAPSRPLGARTLVCPFWVRLDLGADGGRRDILLVADQIRSAEWRRLRALLMRLQGS